MMRLSSLATGIDRVPTVTPALTRSAGTVLAWMLALVARRSNSAIRCGRRSVPAVRRYESCGFLVALCLAVHGIDKKLGVRKLGGSIHIDRCILI